LKQCPACHRTYSDNTQVYCLDDGSVLQRYEPAPTLRIAAPLVTNNPPPRIPPPMSQAPIRSSRWPIYVLAALVFLVLCAGIGFLLIVGYSHMTQSSASASQTAENLNSPTPSTQPSPSPSTSPSSQALVGVWRTTVIENGSNTVITVTFRANGTTHYMFRARGTSSYNGAWQYSDETLFEKFPTGASGKSSIRWIDPDTFELTIIDNGVPAYIGLKRQYKRVRP
jgi:hypothetical protein